MSPLSHASRPPCEHGLTSGVSISLALFLWGKGAGAHRKQSMEASKQERPPCPVTVAEGVAPHRALGPSIPIS